MAESLTRRELDERVTGALAKGGVAIEDESERRGIPGPIRLSWLRNDSGLWADEAEPDIETVVRMSLLIEVTLDRAA